MGDFVELSSDSDDTIIFSITTENYNQSEVADVVTKYNSHTSTTDKDTSKSRSSSFYNLSDDEDELLKDDGKKIKLHVPENVSPQSGPHCEQTTLRQLSIKYQQCLNKEVPPLTLKQQEKIEIESQPILKVLTEKQQRNLKKGAEKQKKLLERQLKKEEIAKEKAMKQALAAVNKNIKREECMKFITVLLDDSVGELYGSDFVDSLRDVEVTYQLQPQIFPGIITWSRRIESHSITNDGKTTVSSQEVETKEVLLMMTSLDFIEHVNNSTLCTHIQSLKVILNNKNVTLGIFGLQKYLRYRKNLKHSEFRSHVANDASVPNYNSKLFKDAPNITKITIETSLTELQLIASCSYRLVETSVDFGQLILQFTKAIAQLPYKLQKQEKQQQNDWFASGDNKDCVKIDKNGNGLQRLWSQVLTTFPLARLETAEAISAHFPTPSSLMGAYNQCRTQKDGEQLLQDISIRRVVGPLVSMRKIGPEFSKKLYNYFTAVDGNCVL